MELDDLNKSVSELERKIEQESQAIEQLEQKKRVEEEALRQFNEINSTVSYLHGIDETHKKNAQYYYGKIFENRDKEMQYFEKLTHFEYYRMLVEDLTAYIDSLERSLVNYHKEKIDQINKNIHELWKMTYKNGDIRRIEIKAEQKVDNETAVKGNFDYRVVFYNQE